MSYLIELIKDCYLKRRFIYDLARADFKKRFVGSYFGVAWMFIQPIVTVLIYFCIFQLGFKSAPPIPDTPYVIWLIPGIVPWFYFAETLNNGTTVLKEYDFLVKKVVFNVSILPIIKLVSCFIVHCIFIFIMIAVFLSYAKLPMISWFGLIYYSFALSMFSLALMYITSSINVFFNDMAQLVSITLQFGMWLTPIMWSTQMFGPKAVVLEKFLKINPVYYIVAGYRDSMLFGNMFYSRPFLTLYFWIVTIVMLILGLKMFNKLKPHFSDVL